MKFTLKLDIELPYDVCVPMLYADDDVIHAKLEAAKDAFYNSVYETMQKAGYPVDDTVLNRNAVRAEWNDRVNRDPVIDLSA